MGNGKVARLLDRRVLRISGADARSFLQGLVTNDIERVEPGKAVFAGLLGPQGKILADFFITRQRDAYLIDCPAQVAEALMKRFALYKLRSAVTVEDVSNDLHVEAAWGQDDASVADHIQFRDPRHAELGVRVLTAEHGIEASASLNDYNAHRIALAIPDGGQDYVFGDAFPHEACYDLLSGVDFQKGCYVGQEVVSRMQHRGTARKRIVAVMGVETLTPGVEITANTIPLGVLGSASGMRGIALVRLDRAADAMAASARMAAGGVGVTLQIPAWANYTLEAAPAGASH